MSKQDENNDVAGDDLTAYDDLVRALQAPGTPAELVDEERFRAAYREIHTAPAVVIPLRRRFASRLGTGGTAVIVAAVLTGGGVAAAYTGNLPDPVQEFAHSVLGAPAPEPPSPLLAPSPAIPPSADEPEATPSVPEDSSTAAPTPSPTPEETKSPKKDRSSPSPTDDSHTDDLGDPSPSAAPNDQPTNSPVKQPVVAQSATTVSMAAASHLVGYGDTVMLAGVVTDRGGQPVTDRKVVLQVRGNDGWRRVALLKTDSAGVVTTSTAPVTGLNRYRWRTRPALRSPVWRVRVRATLSSSYVIEGERTTISATSLGGQAGDVVSFYVRVKKTLTLVGEAPLAADGRALLTVPTPQRNRVVVMRLARTLDHTPARTKLLVIAPVA